MAVDTAQLTRVFKKIRAARKALARDFKARDDVLKAQLEIVGNAMLKFLHETNQDSAKGAEGVFYKQLQITPIGSDWGAFYAWVAQENAFDFLEKRIKVTEIVEYMKTHTIEGVPQLPPGVSVNREWVIRVRKANKKDDGFETSDEGDD